MNTTQTLTLHEAPTPPPQEEKEWAINQTQYHIYEAQSILKNLNALTHSLHAADKYDLLLSKIQEEQNNYSFCLQQIKFYSENYLR